MDLPGWGDDVKSVVAELGLQLADKQRGGMRLYQSTARRGFTFCAVFANEVCHSVFAVRMIKEST